ncbi:interleukin-22 receptor subunit alpha-2 [Monodelphis domestica]|uniref:interleukin-22 receptor subunit alpha-2 n=1 Tax=Monodelphis domestica TaxID=13616 RepID=UPI00020F63D8|nr:interleukin-22 receptor subunit alpha-2 [Monodelphis domestica]
MMLKQYFLIFLIKFLWTYGGGSQPVRESLKVQRVEFQSFNLQSILHWLPGSAFTHNNTVYFVQYKMYGQKEWTNKEECWGIYEIFCDLTNETSDVEEPYYGRVKATSAHIHTPWSMTKRFSPWLETKIGPPSISVIQSGRSIQLILQAPNSPYKDRKGRNKSLKDYYDLIYRVFIINNSQDMKRKLYEGTNEKIEMDIKPGANYCVAAEMYLFELNRSSESTEICTFKIQRNGMYI